MRVLAAILSFYACASISGDASHAQVPVANVPPAQDESPVGQRVRSSAARVSDAVVRIDWGPSHARSGVIVTGDGYIVWSGTSRSNRELTVVLSSGESIKATNCGWSSEWQVGVLKLDGEREWRHVDFGSTKQALAGDPCFEIGYHASKLGEGKFDRLPATRFGTITRVSPTKWFATDLEHSQFEYGAGTFDKDGRLLGISVPGVSPKHHLSVAAEICTSHWDSFTDGKNLDWVRYPPSAKSLYRRLAAPDQLDQTGFLPRADAPGWNDRRGEAPTAVSESDFLLARQQAVTTTVRIRRRQKDSRSTCWSGVLISPEGHIATCAHTEQLAGEELVVVLPGGRELPAVALGTNWVSDVGLVKITEEGAWDYAQLGDSSTIGPADSVLCAGFPVSSSGRERDGLCANDPASGELATTEILALQQTPYVGWNHELSFVLNQKLWGGASGGGVFDQKGKLVAIYLGPGHGFRIEALRAQEECLKSREATDRGAGE